MNDAFARHSDPSTSHAAAASMRTSDLEQKVLDAIIELNGATTHEISDHTGMPYWSVTPRIRPLVRKNKVMDSGEKRTGESNRKSIVWERHWDDAL